MTIVPAVTRRTGKSHCLFTLSGVAALLLTTAVGVCSPLTPYDLTGSGFTVLGQNNQTVTSLGSTPYNYSNGDITAQASATISPYQSVQVTGNMSGTGSNLVTLEGTAALTYYVMLAGPGSPGDYLININLIASGTASCTGNCGVNAMLTIPQFGLTENSASWSVNNTYSVPSNAQFAVTIQAVGTASYDPPTHLLSSFSALVDPIFAIDPNDNYGSLFTLQFSEGIFNGIAPQATPLPATLPLFASGLGALGLLGWRRKRKASAAIAA